ncbi:MAG: phytoene/squalene synthase family protein [Planctomycetota bacterium]
MNQRATNNNEGQDLIGQSEDAAAVIHRSSRSFSIASSFLPYEIRTKVWALYAWCRSVDDAVDHAISPFEATEALRIFEEDLARCQTGESLLHPASEWIRPFIAAGQIDVRHARELVEGMRMDLEGFTVNTIEDLERYCYHAAGTVGLMMTSLMGVKDRSAVRHAVSLGVAMQMTNIARDVLEDAERGRSYLPGIAKVLEAEPDRISQSVAEILALAEVRYHVALRGLHYLPWRCRIAIRVALEVYREIGREIQRNGCSVMRGRTVISKRRLAWVSTRALLSAMNTNFVMTLQSGMKWNPFSFQELTMTESSDSPNSFLPCTSNQAKQVAFLGLSLTSIMATALFFLVYINPKEEDYSYLPLIYAGVSAAAAVLFHRLSARYDEPSAEPAS